MEPWDTSDVAKNCSGLKSWYSHFDWCQWKKRAVEKLTNPTNWIPYTYEEGYRGEARQRH